MANIDVKVSESNNSNSTQQINIRAENSDVELIDNEIKKMETQFPGLKVSRSEMALILLRRSLGVKNG